MRDNNAEIKGFLELKEANGQSKWTIQNQGIILRKFNKFLDPKSYREATEDDVISFISRMNKSHAPSTMNLLKIVIKSFYRHLYRMKKHEYPPQVQNIRNCHNGQRRIPIRPEDILTKEDIADIVRYCNNFRDKALVVTLYESAARIGEFIRVNVNHMKFDDKGAVLVIEGKTGSRRIRLIESVPFLQRWIESHPRKHMNNAALWCSSKGQFQRLDISSMRLILSQLKKHSEIVKPLNPHAFRHSRLTELAKFLSDAKLKVFAGWRANSTMSSVYVHLSGKDLDSDLLRIAGVETKEEKLNQSPLKVKRCSRCNSLNGGIGEFCHLCGKPFNEEKVVEDTLDTQLLKNEIRELKEILYHSGDVVDNMWGTIDKLKAEIRTMKLQGSS